MKNLPRLELTEDADKNNEFIIFRNSSKDKKVKTAKYVTKKKRNLKKKSMKKRTRKSRKGIFNIF